MFVGCWRQTCGFLRFLSTNKTDNHYISEISMKINIYISFMNYVIEMERFMESLEIMRTSVTGRNKDYFCY